MTALPFGIPLALPLHASLVFLALTCLASGVYRAVSLDRGDDHFGRRTACQQGIEDSRIDHAITTTTLPAPLMGSAK